MSDIFNFKTDFTGESAEGEIIGYVLPNGLKVVLLKNHTTPVVAVDIWYQVGSKDEKPGKSGFAHLFEHMMFEGSDNVGKAQHMRLINNVGGMVNASTTQDRTNYWEIMPSNQLELALWLEADRMRSLNISQENFDNQRATVKEERRLRIDNQPYMKVVFEIKDQLAYQNYAYQHSVIGSMDDLDRATLDDVRKFHETYYRPNNAIMSIVGDFRLESAWKLVRKYFSEIPSGNHVPLTDLSESRQNKERRIVYKDPFAPFPAYLCSYHIPDRLSHDYYALELIEKILLDGESSRFYRLLIEEKRLSLHLMGGNDGKLGPGLFFLFAQVHPERGLPELEIAVQKEFERLISERVSEKEIEKAKNKIKADFLAREESVRTISNQLCLYTTVFDNPAFMYSELNHFLALDADALRSVAEKYFSTKNRSVIEVYPEETEGLL